MRNKYRNLITKIKQATCLHQYVFSASVSFTDIRTVVSIHNCSKCNKEKMSQLRLGGN